MKKSKKFTMLVSIVLIVSMLCACGGNAVNAKLEKDTALIRQELDTYLNSRIFEEYSQQTKLYDNYISCVSVNFLSSLILMVDEKLGKISSSFGVSEKIAKKIYENYTSEVEKLVYDEETIPDLTKILTQNCQTEILAIEPLEEAGTYSVQIQVTNLDLETSINANEMIVAIIDNIESEDVIDITVTGLLDGGVNGLSTGLEFSELGGAYAVALGALGGILKSCGENAIETIKTMLTEVVEDIGIINTCTCTITVIVSGETMYIVEGKTDLENACHGIFNPDFLNLDTTSFYEPKVQELIEIRETRKANDNEETDEETTDNKKEPETTDDNKDSATEATDNNNSTNTEATDSNNNNNTETTDSSNDSGDEATSKDTNTEQIGDSSLAENQETTTPDQTLDPSLNSIEALCSAFCETIDSSQYIYMGMPEKMKKYFEIPEDETIYLAHDDTIFRSGKDGFVITDQGVYVNKSFENKLYFVSFEEFTDTPSYLWESGYLYADSKLIACVAGLSDEGKTHLENLFTNIILLQSK